MLFRTSKRLKRLILQSDIELDDGNIYRKTLYLMVKTMVSGVDFPQQTNPLKVTELKNLLKPGA